MLSCYNMEVASVVLLQHGSGECRLTAVWKWRVLSCYYKEVVSVVLLQHERGECSSEEYRR